MRRRESEGVSLDACEGCGGVCVTPKRLQQLILQPLDRIQKLLEQVDRFRPERQKQLVPHPACPHCGVVMVQSRLGMLTREPVNNCMQCFGLFLENATLKDILLGQQR
jgi:Zn-finger nucleic acid-binding protein